MKFKHWYTVTAVAVFNSLLLFLLLNLVLYFVMVGRKQPTPVAEYGGKKLMKAYPGWRESDINDLFRESYLEEGFEYEPFTEFRNAPNPRKKRFLNVDPAGFRISKNQAPWPPRPDATNVFVFGGSTGFGLGLPDDETIPSYLQDCAPASGHLAVYNFARSYYYSSQELALFQQLLKAGHIPQVAVFIDGLNEFNFWGADEPAFTLRLRSFMAGNPDTNPLDDVPAVKAAHWMKTHWTKRTAKKAPAPDYADRAVLDSVINRWLANKRIIELLAQGFGVRTIFVWQPVATYKYDLRYHFLAAPDEWFVGKWPRGRYGYEQMEDLREQGKLGSNVLWLADMQQDRHENLYVDKWHYTAAFSRTSRPRSAAFCANPIDAPGLDCD